MREYKSEIIQVNPFDIESYTFIDDSFNPKNLKLHK